MTVPLASGVSYRPAGSLVTGWDCSSPGAGTQIVCQHAESLASGGGAAEPLRLRTNVAASAPSQWTTAITTRTDGEPATRLADNDKSFQVTLEKVDLTLTKTHVPGSIRGGRRGAFTLTASNVGNTASSGTISVVDTVDPAFQSPRASGTGWTCTTTGQKVECTRDGSLAAGASAPAITLYVTVPTSTAGTRESSPLARVTNAGDPFPSNDTAADPVSVVTTSDLSLTKIEPDDLVVGSIATITYRVRNIGVETADGAPTARLRDLLPVLGSVGLRSRGR